MSESGWISVNDRLPEIDALVIAYDANYFCDHYDVLRWNGYFWARKAWPAGYNPTHWMPIPNPPEVTK